MTERVYVTAVLEGPIEETWKILRDFNGLPDYHPMFASSHIEDGKPADQIGCVRNFKDHQGGQIREQLLALDDRARRCLYSILESPMPLWNYVAELRLLPITDGARCYAEWTADFECAEADAATLVDTVGNGVFQGGFDALKQRFAA